MLIILNEKILFYLSLGSYLQMIVWTGEDGKYLVLKLGGYEYCPINEYINLVKSVIPTDEEMESMYKELNVDVDEIPTTHFVFESNTGL